MTWPIHGRHDFGVLGHAIEPTFLQECSRYRHALNAKGFDETLLDPA
jgi:hypothetical protein